jgi:hypothetical protein
MKPILTLWLGLLAGAGYGQVAPTPAELLSRMRTTYAEARTYRDRGSMTVQYLTGRKVETPRKKAFSTAFARNGGLRFASIGADEKGALRCEVVVFDGTRTRVWQGQRNAVDSSRSLTSALTVAGASTGSAARRVTGLLLGDPNVSMAWEKNLRKVQLVGPETVNNRATYHLTASGGQVNFPTQLHLWLDAENGLLVRLTERTRVSEFEALTTLDFEPDVNVELPANLLAFDYQNCVK